MHSTKYEGLVYPAYLLKSREVLLRKIEKEPYLKVYHCYISQYFPNVKV